jgi:hypothetical protein
VIAAHLEDSAMRHWNLDLIAFFQFERVDHAAGKRSARLLPQFRQSGYCV